MGLLTRKFPTYLGILILMIGIGFGIWYVNSKKTSVTNEIQPDNVRITNVADNRFVVSWTTSVATKGVVTFGKVGEKLGQEIKDDRDKLGTNSSNYLTHYVTVDGLQPSTSYAFRILSGDKKTTYDSNGSPYSVQTGPTITNIPTAQAMYGQILESSSLPAEGAIVYVVIPGSAPASTIVTSSGSYTIPISTLRTANLGSYITYDPAATILAINVAGGKQVASATVSTENINPVPDITLGQTYDFKSPAENTPMVALVEPQSASPSPSNPLSPNGEMGEVFNLEPLNNTPSYTDVTITYPSVDKEIVSVARPEIMGNGPKTTVLSIVVSSTKKTYKDTIAIDSLGKWGWSPVVDLPDGTYNITIAYVDSNSTEKTVKRSFVVNTKLAGVEPAFVTTPSANLKSPTPTPSIRAATVATDSGIPVTGVIENTMLTVVFGTVIMISGALLLML